MINVSELAALSTQVTSEDQIVFKTLRGANAIVEWASSRVEEYERRTTDSGKYIDTLMAIRNEVIPIHRIPTEVLMRIFEDSCLGRTDARLQGVCRRWHAVILSTQRFWAHLLEVTELDGRKACHEDMLCTCLSRSGDLPLKVIMSTSFAYLSKELYHHRHRLSTLKVSLLTQKDNRDLQETISAGMPILRCLEVDAGTYVTWTPLTCRQDLVARLRELKMPAHLLHPSTITASLQNIDLWGNIPDLDIFVDALTRCPYLEALSLHNCHLRILGNSDHKADLPHLRRLAFRSHGPSIVALLTRITFPNTTCITMSDFSQIDDPVVTALLPDSPVFDAADPIDRVLLCWFTHPKRVASVRYSSMGRERLCLDNLPYWTIGIASLWAVLRAHPITTLSLAPDSGHMQDPVVVWSELWDAFPGVHTLELPACKDTPHWLKCEYVKRFLEKQADEIGLDYLTIVWEVPPRISGSDVDATRGLHMLEGILRVRYNEGKAYLGTLRLHRFRRGPPAPSSVTDVGTNTNGSGDFDEDIVNKLRDLVGHVETNDAPIDLCGET